MRQKPIPTVLAAERAQAGQSLQSRFGSVGNLQPLSAGLSHSRPPAALHVKEPGDLPGHPAGISLWQPIPGSAASPSFTARHTDYLRPSPPRSAEAAPAAQAPAVPRPGPPPHKRKPLQTQPGQRGGNERKGRKGHSVPPHCLPRGLTAPRCFGVLHFQGTVPTDSSSVTQHCARSIPSFCWWQRPPAVGPSGTPQEPSRGRWLSTSQGERRQRARTLSQVCTKETRRLSFSPSSPLPRETHPVPGAHRGLCGPSQLTAGSRAGSGGDQGRGPNVTPQLRGSRDSTRRGRRPREGGGAPLPRRGPWP